MSCINFETNNEINPDKYIDIINYSSYGIKNILKKLNKKIKSDDYNTCVFCQNNWIKKILLSC